VGYIIIAQSESSEETKTGTYSRTKGITYCRITGRETQEYI
jgi:hypothetical protein